MLSRFAALFSVVFCMFFAVNYTAAADCAGLKSRSGPGIQITVAEIVPAGPAA